MFGKRLISIGFILIIVGANIWLVYLMGNSPIPEWLRWLAEIAVVCLLVGVVSYLVGKALAAINRR